MSLEKSPSRAGYGPVSTNNADDQTLVGDREGGGGRRRSSNDTQRPSGSGEEDGDDQFDVNAAIAQKENNAIPSGRVSMSTVRTQRTSRAVEHFDGNPNIPPYEQVADNDPEYSKGGGKKSKSKRWKRIPGAQWPKRSLRTALADRANAAWLGELLVVLASLGCFAAAIWLLTDMDGRQYREWRDAHHGMAPNALLSLLVALAVSLMLFVAVQCLGQLRWVYFQRSARPLVQLDAFAGAAGRGPWGALAFLLKGDGLGALAVTLGAVVLFAALAVDPFAMQMLDFPEKRANLTGEGAVNATWMPAAREYKQSGDILSNSTMRKALYAGLLGFETPTSFGCPTGNCTWPDFSSLGLCGSCEDVSASATKNCSSSEHQQLAYADDSCNQLTYTISDYGNLTLVVQNGSSSASALNGFINDGSTFTMVKSVVSDAYPNGLDDPALFDFAVAQLIVNSSDSEAFGTWTAKDLQNPSWNITACSVKWCAKVYENVEAVNGVLTNDSPAREVDLTASSSSSCWDSSDCQEFTVSDSSALPSSSSANSSTTTFKISGITNSTNTSSTSAIQTLLAFDYNVTVADADSSVSDVTAAAGALATTMLWDADIPASLAHIATSLTNIIRNAAAASTNTSAANNSNSNATSANANTILGTPTHLTPTIAVSWPWIALPAAILFLCLVLFVVTVVLSAMGDGRVLWKASTLPLLLHGPPRGWADDELRGRPGRDAGKSKDRNVARGMGDAVLRREDGVVRFVKA